MPDDDRRQISMDEFIEQMKEDDTLTDEQKFQFEVLLRIHQRMGIPGIHPPTEVEIDPEVIHRYLRMAYFSAEGEIVQQEMHFKPADLFQTTLLMGIAIGVNLERERRGK